MLVEVSDPTSGRSVFLCDGPDDLGGCQHTPGTDSLPCFGLQLRTLAAPAGVDGFRFRVTGSGPVCPLRVFAQPSL